jgi:hypothetical protein
MMALLGDYFCCRMHQVLVLIKELNQRAVPDFKRA